MGLSRRPAECGPSLPGQRSILASSDTASFAGSRLDERLPLTPARSRPTPSTIKENGHPQGMDVFLWRRAWGSNPQDHFHGHSLANWCLTIRRSPP